MPEIVWRSGTRRKVRRATPIPSSAFRSGELEKLKGLRETRNEIALRSWARAANHWLDPGVREFLSFGMAHLNQLKHYPNAPGPVCGSAKRKPRRSDARHSAAATRVTGSALLPKGYGGTMRPSHAATRLPPRQTRSPPQSARPHSG